MLVAPSIENASVVFVVKNNAPGMFTHEFLIHNKVFKERFEPAKSISLGPVSQIKYPGGYTFQATEGLIKIEIDYPSRQQLAEIDQIPDIITEAATRLYEVTSYMNYQAIGINFRAVSTEGGIDELVYLDRLPDTASPKEIKYQLRYDAFVVMITLALGQRTSTGEEVVVADANYHLDLGGGGQEALSEAFLLALRKRQKCLTHFATLITEPYD